MADFQDVNLTICKLALLNVLMLKLRRNIHLILCYGNMLKKMSHHGLHLGAMAVQVGILNAQQCQLAA
ncbi:hypothetical protein D3C75_963520 [compost metagenome]